MCTGIKQKPETDYGFNYDLPKFEDRLIKMRDTPVQIGKMTPMADEELKKKMSKLDPYEFQKHWEPMFDYNNPLDPGGAGRVISGSDRAISTKNLFFKQQAKYAPKKSLISSSSSSSSSKQINRSKRKFGNVSGSSSGGMK